MFGYFCDLDTVHVLSVSRWSFFCPDPLGLTVALFDVDVLRNCVQQNTKA